MKKLVRKLAIIAALWLLCPGAFAQQKATSEPTPNTAEPEVSQIFTNQDLAADRPFVLLLIHDGGQGSTAVYETLRRPVTQELADWLRTAELQTANGRDPWVQQKHADLFRKHVGKLPVVALVQMSGRDRGGDALGHGAVWYSTDRLPMGEKQLASELTTHYEATLQAYLSQAMNAPKDVPSTVPVQQQMPLSAEFPVYRIPNSGGPEASYPIERERRPLFNPQVDIKAPDNFRTSVTGGLDPETRQSIETAAYAGGGLFCSGCAVLGLLVGGGMIVSAVMRGYAQTGAPKRRKTS